MVEYCQPPRASGLRRTYTFSKISRSVGVEVVPPNRGPFVVVTFSCICDLQKSLQIACNRLRYPRHSHAKRTFSKFTPAKHKSKLTISSLGHFGFISVLLFMRLFTPWVPQGVPSGRVCLHFASLRLDSLRALILDI